MIQFDVPMDFSGIAKGYILDIMAQRLARDGWNDFLVDAGGDMVVNGKNRKGSNWHIDIENIPEGELLIKVSGKAIATSGITRRQWESPDGKRYHHLIHPKHPYSFSFDLLSVTAISTSAERADFLAKTLFLMVSKKDSPVPKNTPFPLFSSKTKKHIRIASVRKRKSILYSHKKRV
jgi:thiamine biosynthesis lipoprotein